MPSICPLEASEGKALKKWADYHPIAKKYLIHIPNGGMRNKLEAKGLREQGVKTGVSDYFLAFPTKGASGLWIELKRREKSLSRVSVAQQEWIDEMNAIGYVALVCRGWEAAAEAIEWYLVDSRPKGGILSGIPPLNDSAFPTHWGRLI